jgi:SAM-dependent methyltransferase
MDQPGDFKDLFSRQSSDYARFRPSYPPALFELLAGKSPRRSLAWDCGTGNGQAAVELAGHFERVVATDPAQKQLERAKPHPGVTYLRASAESSGLEDSTVDLVTAAQAFHWFNQEEFFREVRRVASPGGLLAFWCYGLARISPEVDAVVSRLYAGTLGPYWEQERTLVDEGYRSVKLPFQELPAPRLEMRADWSLEHLLGYLGTWSALQAFVARQGRDPREAIREELKVAWGPEPVRRVSWELGLRMARVS